MNHHGSRVALSDENKERLVEVLNNLLAATSDLYSQVKHAHWNVKGEAFFMHHELFDQIAGPLPAFADTLAERCAALGGFARGTVRMAAAASPLPELDGEVCEGIELVRAVCDRYQAYNQALRESLHVCDDLDDLVTQDRLIEILNQTEKDMWFLESHLRGTAPVATTGRGAAQANPSSPLGRGNSGSEPRPQR